MLAMMPYGLCTLFTSSSSTATKCEDVALLDKKKVTKKQGTRYGYVWKHKGATKTTYRSECLT